MTRAGTGTHRCGGRERGIIAHELLFIRDSDEQRDYERLLNPGWTELWAGTATFELAGTQGNADASTFAVGMNAARLTNADKTTAYRRFAAVGGITATLLRA